MLKLSKCWKILELFNYLYPPVAQKVEKTKKKFSMSFHTYILQSRNHGFQLATILTCFICFIHCHHILRACSLAKSDRFLLFSCRVQLLGVIYFLFYFKVTQARACNRIVCPFIYLANYSLWNGRGGFESINSTGSQRGAMN